MGLRGGDAVAEGFGAGEGFGARIAGPEHPALDVHASRDPRRVRTYLDHDLAAFGQPEPDDGGQVAGSEQLVRRRAAQMVDAPPGEVVRIDGTRAS
ncbi:hypothetical protein GCM10009557_51850 [Virgisporangium ochraceum]|uniref:Uncharacterized protein n=1 Tax=Virgisporangium ochraceum TaxID=65505 RepID=A0A8J4EHD2_9ACTN|nr:hypothetical protein Voc01_097760 [Virgisporangium ochraceum]